MLYRCINIYKAHMSPALNGSSAIRRFEGSDAIEIRNGITFDFYTGLPHIHVVKIQSMLYRTVDLEIFVL